MEKEKIEFSLDLWETGDYDVVTRRGEEVVSLTLIPVDDTSGYCLCGAIDGCMETWTGAGSYHPDGDSNFDLMLVKKPLPTVWMNIYWRNGDYIFGGDKFETKERAQEVAEMSLMRHVTTIELEVPRG